MRMGLAVSLCAALMCGVWACGSDDADDKDGTGNGKGNGTANGNGNGTNNAPFQPSVSSTKKVKDLSLTEASSLCTELGTSATLTPAQSCMFAAQSAFLVPGTTFTTEACNATLNQCLASTAGLPSFEINCNEIGFDTDELASCEATVGEVAACFNDLLGPYLTVAKQATCSASLIADPAIDASAKAKLGLFFACSGAGTPIEECEGFSACKTLDEKCPDLFSDDEAVIVEDPAPAPAPSDTPN